jgi:hypothetical protein
LPTNEIIIHTNGDVYIRSEFATNIPDIIKQVIYCDYTLYLLINDNVHICTIGKLEQIADDIESLMLDGRDLLMVDFDGNIYDSDKNIIPGCQIAPRASATTFAKSARY